MKRCAVIVLFVLAIGGSMAIVVPGLPEVASAASPNTLTFDVACDCRAGSPAFFNGNRGDAWIVSGKIFPAGTLTGVAGNDPTQPVRGVTSIGEWTCRGQASFPFPPNIASAYANSPFAFNTQYFILNDGRALTVEGFPVGAGERLSITGGIGGYSGAAGEVEEAGIGTNVTGCPNFRAKFTVQPGSMRGPSN